MANKNKDYSIADANKILEDFQELSGVDALSLSRKPIDAYFRALLYKVLMDFNYMNDRQIEDFFWTKRIKRTRVATSIVSWDEPIKASKKPAIKKYINENNKNFFFYI